jgi:hypothetical protein
MRKTTTAWSAFFQLDCLVGIAFRPPRLNAKAAVSLLCLAGAIIPPLAANKLAAATSAENSRSIRVFHIK